MNAKKSEIRTKNEGEAGAKQSTAVGTQPAVVDQQQPAAATTLIDQIGHVTPPPTATAAAAAVEQWLTQTIARNSNSSWCFRFCFACILLLASCLQLAFAFLHVYFCRSFMSSQLFFLLACGSVVLALRCGNTSFSTHKKSMSGGLRCGPKICRTPL